VGDLLPLMCLLSMADVLDRLNLGYAAPVTGPVLRVSAAQRIVGDRLCRGWLSRRQPTRRVIGCVCDNLRT
jgi:hypothetical protein